jgi:CubicO group peptidase (beta-lactamase class C family)
MHLKMITTMMAITALLSEGTFASVHEKPSSDGLDRAIEARMKEVGLVGVGAAIIVHKKIVWTKGYGFADKGRGIPFTPETIMNIGSISKTFTGAALMHAVQEKKLSLDEDVNRYIPFKVSNPFFPDERITLRQLATHTSSVTDRWSVYESTYHYGGDSPESLEPFLKSYFTANGEHYSSDNFLNARPGRQREYSNIGAALAGYIVERAVGQKLNVYTKRHIFRPLRMKSSGWFLSEVDRDKHATLYVAQSGMSIPIQLYGGTTYPDGGVRTSVAELSRFFAALLSEGEFDGARILSRESASEMLRLQFTDSSKPDNVNPKEKNSGIFWQTKFNGTRVGHGGKDPGVITEMLADWSGDIGVIVFTNTSLADEEMSKFAGLLDDLWNYAESLK